MSPNETTLHLDPEITTCQIEEFLRQKHEELNHEGAILGLSGGLDSAIVAYLTARAMGRENVTLLYLPDRDSNPHHRQDAELVAQELGIPLAVQDITPALKGLHLYNLLPLKYLPSRKTKAWLVNLGKRLLYPHRENEILSRRLEARGNSWTAKGRAYGCTKHRLRMVALYLQAEAHNLMVVGTANKTELLTGTFSKWGCDHCAEVMPILHLYRSQLPPLAEYLGVPERVRSKPADPDILPGLDDKGALLGSFVEVDQILWRLENDIPLGELETQFGKEPVKQIARLRRLSAPMRESPYTIESR